MDTAILLCGILTCRAAFRSIPKSAELASEIFNRVDWTWLSEDTPILPHGWTPETGFLQYRWDNYSEMMMMYLLGIGIAHPSAAGETWDAWKRTTFRISTAFDISALLLPCSSTSIPRPGSISAANATAMRIIFRIRSSPRMFIAASAWIWQSSFRITARISGASRHRTRKRVTWSGAALRPQGRSMAPLFPAPQRVRCLFCLKPAMRVLANHPDRYGTGAWCRYGFVDAFNPLTNWYDSDVIGIDAGITMVMAENARTAFVWDTFMKNPEARRGMERAGFKSYQPSGD